LLFFLIVFLLLLIYLLQARLAQGQEILLVIVLVTLAVVLCGAWLLRRSQRVVLVQTSQPKVVSPLPSAPVPVFTRPETPLHFLQLSPGQFEDFVGDLLECTGQWSDVQRIGGKGDRGADLLARDRFGRPFIAQCKRYGPGHKVVAREIRDFLGAKGLYGADEGLFVTTSSFTEEARANVGPFQHTVFLWDGEKLLQLVQAYWEALPARWKE
jgi:HJR/Mrr/RecB family endonuclease